MTIDELNHSLEKTVNELARQTFYAMNEFRENIVKYLKTL